MLGQGPYRNFSLKSVELFKPLFIFRKIGYVKN